MIDVAWRPLTLALCLCLGLGLSGLPARAETDAAATAANAAEMLEQAGFALLEARSARDRVRALTQVVRAYEEGLLALREGIRQAALRERTLTLTFESERDRLARLLAVLQSIETAPAPLLLIHPEGPLGTARSGMIVSDVTPAVAQEAAALRRQLEELIALRDLQQTSLGRMSLALDSMQEARATLNQAIADRRSLPANITEDADAMAALIAGVDGLDMLAERLAATPPADTIGLPDFADARGALPLPALGAVLRQFNETDASGVARPGLILATPARALVTAPWPASVRYAGPLLDYGNVIILEPEGEYLMVIAGLGTLYVSAGDLVSSRGALGLMPGDAAVPSGDLLRDVQPTGATDLTETLYIEVRVGETPVDPANWFSIDGL